jgi:hypothetical protein
MMVDEERPYAADRGLLAGPAGDRTHTGEYSPSSA